jgi:Zn-dependent oligopeptidase
MLLPSSIKTDISLATELSQNNIDETTSLPLNRLILKKAFFAREKTIDALEMSLGYVSHLDLTYNSDEVREEHNKMLPRVAELSANILLNQAFWLSIQMFAETEEAQKGQ